MAENGTEFSILDVINTLDQQPPFSWHLFQKSGQYFSQLLFPSFTIKDASNIQTSSMEILMFEKHQTMRQNLIIYSIK